MNYYERHLGDYAKKTAHLSMMEHGAYGLLLDRYYDTEAPIPEDQAHRLARARTKEERAAVDAVLSEYFVLRDGLWHHDRCDAEVLRAQAKINSARENGKRGGRPPNSTRVPQGTKPGPCLLETQQKPSGLSLGFENGTQSKTHQTPDTKLKEEAKEGARKRTPGFDAGSLLLPDWLPPDLWARWMVARRQAKKPITAAAAQQQLADLAKWRDAGHDPVAIIEASIRNGWQGLFEPKPGAAARLTAVPKSGFAEQDYLTDFRGQPLKVAS